MMTKSLIDHGLQLPHEEERERKSIRSSASALSLKAEVTFKSRRILLIGLYIHRHLEELKKNSIKPICRLGASWLRTDTDIDCAGLKIAFNEAPFVALKTPTAVYKVG